MVDPRSPFLFSRGGAEFRQINEKCVEVKWLEFEISKIMNSYKGHRLKNINRNSGFLCVYGTLLCRRLCAGFVFGSYFIKQIITPNILENIA
jgi:hypothetical protein